jgi:uncharacterized protein YndB with AHSA1/START domain
MAQDKVEREVVVAAPVERVWEILTQAQHVGKWFGDSADIDLRDGGEIVLRWEKYGEFFGTIERIERPRHFSYRWVPGVPGKKPGKDDSTLVEFTLTPDGARTKLRVVETGFSRLPRPESDRAEQFEDNSKGWTTVLDDLRKYSEQLPV